MDWFSDPPFIENAEELAMSLIDSFPINRIEALTIIIIESMCSRGIICTKKKIRDMMTSQFKIRLDEKDTKSIERIFNIVSSGQSRLNSISSPWIEYLWKEKAFSNELMEATDIPDCKDIADFYEIDPRAISLIKHAIKAKSPIALTIDDFLRHMSLGIIKQLLEKEGIYCLIGSKMHSDDSGVYAMQAIQAMHLEGIVIFPENEPVEMAKFISMAQIFGLRFATLKNEGQIVISESDDESTNDDIPSIEYVPTINVKPHHISGEALRKKAAEYFGSDNPDFLRILINSKSNVAALCRSKALINEIVEKEDWESLSKFLGDAPKADITILEGSLEEFCEYVKSHSDESTYAMCFDEEKDSIPIPSISYGKKNDPKTQAHKLFSTLRELDALNAKKVFARCPQKTGVSLAVYNRLIRSAGFKIIDLIL